MKMEVTWKLKMLLQQINKILEDLYYLMNMVWVGEAQNFI